MRYYCCDERRREVVRQLGSLNGLDYVEVHDSGLTGDPLRQLTLFVKFLRPPTLLGLAKDKFRIDGGERIQQVDIAWVEPPTALPPGQPADLLDDLDQPDHFLVIRTKSSGDFSLYTLRLVSGPGVDSAPAGVDPVLATLQFSFKVQCESDFDCAVKTPCPAPQISQPQLDYLAKDYSSLRRMMLDRMSVLMPDWQNRSEADLGITLVELLAYIGDQLSYQQDAIATEAYLGTARRRTSLRRHARLMDYHVHEGCNARAWVRILVNDNGITLPRHTPLLTRTMGIPDRIAPYSDFWLDAISSGAEVFETMEESNLYKDNETFNFYTWGERECCLPKGATKATLEGHHANLNIGDVLIFAELYGPRTGHEEDADTSHRWAVRLAAVEPGNDPSGGLFLDPPNNDPVAITEIQWEDEDALPFPLCISTVTDSGHNEKYLEQVSVAYGNVVLVDHGRSIEGEALGTVPDDRITAAIVNNVLSCERPDAPFIPARFRPKAKRGPLTHALEIYGRSKAACKQTLGKPRLAKPEITLRETSSPAPWYPQFDLLSSSSIAREFVVETEHDGTSFIRFGDDLHGKRPDSGSSFSADYRIGNGSAGNVGLESIVHIVSNDGRLLKAENPMAANGGIDPESGEQIKRDVPEAFRSQERAVTEQDYEKRCGKYVNVQQAAATFRWTGSWHTVFVTADRLGGKEVDDIFENDVLSYLERYRMAGYDLEVDGPHYVPLKLAMTVCVKPDYFRGDVRAALMRIFSKGWRDDGRTALFHPDNFTFGQPVYLSKLYSAAQAVQGVDSVIVDCFQRYRVPNDSKPLEDGVLKMGRLEIARLDNDPNFPERGLLTLEVGGGK